MSSSPTGGRGWYLDPEDRSRQRHWNGRRWSQRTRTTPAPATRSANPHPVISGSASAVLGIVFLITASVALASRESYPLVGSPGCPDALTDIPTLTARSIAAGIAAACLVIAGLGGNHLLAGVEEDAARRWTPRMAVGIVVAALVPLLGYMASVLVPYNVALCRRAGVESRLVDRVTAVIIAAIVAPIASAYWLDAGQCL